MALFAGMWRTPEGDECSVYPVRVTSPRLPLALLFAASAFALTGCSPEAAVPSAPPAAEAEPLFASDEEALAAAEAAYAEYLSVFDEVFTEGGADPSPLEKVATEDVLEADLERARRFQSDAFTQTGQSLVIETALQQHISGPAGTAEVVTYSCLDSYSITVLNADGVDVGNPERAATVTFSNTFISRADGELILARSELWSEGAECEL